MPTERRYYDDSYTTTFRAQLVQRGTHEGRPAVVLHATYFYPESGGQEADRGVVGPWNIADVRADDDGTVWHIVEASAAAPESEVGDDLPATIDWARRFDHMQQHTGQHILSAALERGLGAATLSSHLGEERSTIEIGLGEVDWRAIDSVEAAANAVVWRDLAIERHWVDDEGVKRFALRKPPKFTGRIRIVEIPEWDVSACGGTHTLRTGEVGVIKIVRWEKLRGNIRLEFLCGRRALRDYAWRTETLLESARRRTLKDRELVAHLERAAEERDELRKQVRDLTERVTTAEAIERVGNPPRAVEELRASWPREAVRSFVIQCLAHGAPWAIAGASGPEPMIVAGRAKQGTLNLRDAVTELNAVVHGKGGGSPDLIQVAPAEGARVEAGFAWLRAWMGRATGAS